ncbi:MAG: hypothetical protein J7L15_07295, partial [Clostridiales bacterium]|nr:hypothetical protein [Clostridiales bacterium]
NLNTMLMYNTQNEEYKRIAKQDVINLNSNWVKKTPTKNRITIHNSSDQIMIYRDELTQHLNDGWKIGMRESTCPHCNKTGTGGNMKRYHFNNCKHKGKK